MKWEKVSIFSCLLKIDNVNPVLDYKDSVFQYIDISSVSSPEKRILSAQIIKGVDSPSRARQLIEYEDILMSTVRPNLNAVALVNEEFDGSVASTGFCVLRCDKKKLLPKYLYYWVRSQSFINDMVKKATGASYPAVSDTIVKQSTFPLPPLHIQQQIADTLDKADALRSKDQELLNKYDELAKAIFYDMFGDPATVNNSDAISLSELCDINPKKSETSFHDDLLVSFVPMEDVDEKGNVFASKLRKFKEVSNGFTYFREGDVLFAKITPCMENGKGGIAKNLHNQIGFGSTEFHVVRPNSLLSAEFLSTLLSFKSVRLKAEKMMTGSAGQKRVPKTFFDALKINKSNCCLIKNFNDIYNSIKVLEKQSKNLALNSNLLFESLLKAYFS